MALEQLREKLMARVGDRPLVELVLSTAPNKLTCKGAVSRCYSPSKSSDLTLVLCGSIFSSANIFSSSEWSLSEHGTKSSSFLSLLDIFLVSATLGL